MVKFFFPIKLGKKLGKGSDNKGIFIPTETVEERKREEVLGLLRKSHFVGFSHRSVPPFSVFADVHFGVFGKGKEEKIKFIQEKISISEEELFSFLGSSAPLYVLGKDEAGKLSKQKLRRAANILGKPVIVFNRNIHRGFFKITAGPIYPTRGGKRKRISAFSRETLMLFHFRKFFSAV